MGASGEWASQQEESGALQTPDRTLWSASTSQWYDDFSDHELASKGSVASLSIALASAPVRIIAAAIRPKVSSPIPAPVFPHVAQHTGRTIALMLAATTLLAKSLGTDTLGPGMHHCRSATGGSCSPS